MGWDYHTYIKQPTWFIKIITDLIVNKYKSQENVSSKITNFNRR